MGTGQPEKSGLKSVQVYRMGYYHDLDPISFNERKPGWGNTSVHNSGDHIMTQKYRWYLT